MYPVVIEAYCLDFSHLCLVIIPVVPGYIHRLGETPYVASSFIIQYPSRINLASYARLINYVPGRSAAHRTGQHAGKKRFPHAKIINQTFLKSGPSKIRLQTRGFWRIFTLACPDRKQNSVRRRLFSLFCLNRRWRDVLYDDYVADRLDHRERHDDPLLVAYKRCQKRAADRVHNKRFYAEFFKIEADIENLPAVNSLVRKNILPCHVRKTFCCYRHIFQLLTDSFTVLIWLHPNIKIARVFSQSCRNWGVIRRRMGQGRIEFG